MFNVAICDKDILFCNNLKIHLLKRYAGYFNSIDTYTNSIDIINEIQVNNHTYNIIFTDLFINEDTGISDGIRLGGLVRQISGYDTTFLIYISHKDALASDIVNLHPYAYFKKPVNFIQLDEIIFKSLHQLTDTKNFFTFYKGKTLYKLPYNSIMYFENDTRTTIIHSTDNIYHCNIPLSKLSNDILNHFDMFVRVHYSYIINRQFIKKISNNNVYLYNEINIPISRKYKTHLISAEDADIQ